MEAVIETVRKTEGVFRVYRKEQLSAADPLTRASFFTAGSQQPGHGQQHHGHDHHQTPRRPRTVPILIDRPVPADDLVQIDDLVQTGRGQPRSQGGPQVGPPRRALGWHS
jgi:hypothetical protein